jgi:hypothetical protein
VGRCVGVLVGVRVGVRVGAGVGRYVGVLVGVRVGVRVGAGVGICVGVLVGARVGALVGTAVGLAPETQFAKVLRPWADDFNKQRPAVVVCVPDWSSVQNRQPDLAAQRVQQAADVATLSMNAMSFPASGESAVCVSARQVSWSKSTWSQAQFAVQTRAGLPCGRTETSVRWVTSTNLQARNLDDLR